MQAEIAGQELLLGGDLILSIGTQQTCHTVCLVQSKADLAGSDEIHLTILRGGETMQLVLDVADSRRNFLEP